MEIPFEYRFTPRFADFDSYCLAHHSAYFYWFEEARFYFLACILDASFDDAAKFRSPIIKLGCDFKGPVVFGKDYVVKAKITFQLEKAFLRFDYLLTDAIESRELSHGFTEHVFIDEDNTLLLGIPEWLKEKLGTLQSEWQGRKEAAHASSLS